MKIVIAGAGEVGFHLSKLLVEEEQNITLVDTDEEVLRYASSQLDVQVVLGDISSPEILKSLSLGDTKLFISVTTNESSNLLACILAKEFGAKKTIARIRNSEFLESDQKAYFKEIGVDNLFSPRFLAAREIKRLLNRVSATDVYDFENGKISIIGFTADNSSSLVNKSFEKFYKEAGDQHFKVIVILRKDKTIFPSKKDKIMAGDHIYISTDIKDFREVNKYVGKTLRTIKNVMLIGNTELARETAVLLESLYSIKVITKERKDCKAFLKEVKNVMIIEGDPSNGELLMEEGIENMDAFIALTPNAEINILSSLFAETKGVYKTIALVDNPAYTHISQKIGVDTLINKKLLAANNIFRHIRKGKVEAIASFHGISAEIIEFTIHKRNQLIKKPLRDIKMPDGAVLAGLIRGEMGIIPSSDMTLQIDDKVIIFVMPYSLKKIESLFK